MGWLKEILDENRRTVETWPEWKRRVGMSEEMSEAETLVSEVGRLRAENAQLKAELEAYEAIPHDKDGTPFAAASAWRAECNRIQEELAQAKRSYDGAVAAHHEAKSQYRDLIEAHRRELAGWEAAHVALYRELARCQQERDGACNVVAGANHLLLKAGEREARLMGAVTLLTTGEPGSFLAARFPATLRVARQALEEAGT